MDTDPLIADLNKYKEELIASIQIAIGFNELHKADRYIAHDMAEIKGEKHSNDPFRHLNPKNLKPFCPVIQHLLKTLVSILTERNDNIFRMVLV